MTSNLLKPIKVLFYLTLYNRAINIAHLNWVINNEIIQNWHPIADYKKKNKGGETKYLGNKMRHYP